MLPRRETHSWSCFSNKHKRTGGDMQSWLMMIMFRIFYFILFYMGFPPPPPNISLAFSLSLSLFIVVQLQLSPFSSHLSHTYQPSLPPTLDPNPLWLCPCVLYTCSLMTLPPFSPLSPPIYLRSVYCQFVLYFNVSGYVFLAYLFC